MAVPPVIQGPRVLSGATHRAGLALVVVVAAGCDGANDSRISTDRPSLRLIDSILLKEPDSTLLGDPGPYFVIDGLGRLYIPDEQSGRVQRYEANGAYDKTFGRRGRGPGEFGFVGPALLVVDTLLLVEANFQRRIHVFSTVSGNYLYSVPFAGINISSAVATDRKLVWGHYDFSGQYTVMLADRDSVLRGPVPNTSPLRSSQHPRPEVFRAFPELDRWSAVPVVAWSDTVLFGYGPTNWLVRATLDGTALDTIEVPVVRRRGVKETGLALWGAKDFKVEEASRAISATFALWRMPNGEIVVWHYDGSFENPAPNKFHLTGIGWITLLSADLTRACVDAEVTSPGSDRARLALRGDTLYVFDQVIADTVVGNIRSLVRRYHLSSEGCNWQLLSHR